MLEATQDLLACYHFSKYKVPFVLILKFREEVEDVNRSSRSSMQIFGVFLPHVGLVSFLIRLCQQDDFVQHTHLQVNHSKIDHVLCWVGVRELSGPTRFSVLCSRSQGDPSPSKSSK
jgi:hypothetical protein